MEIYLYCSYEQSQKGFTLTQIAGDSLVPCPNAPEIIGEFFYYDRYQVVWRDLPSAHQPNKREIATDGGFFGIRGLTGRIRGERWGNANIAFWAQHPGDMISLRRIAMGILGDVDGFTVMLMRQLSIGGDAGYELDIPVFRNYLNQFTQSSRVKLLVDNDHPVMNQLPMLQRRDAAKNPLELVRLAVSVTDWEGLASKGGKGLFNRRQPNPLLTPEQFKSSFTGHGPIWELHSVDTQ